MTALDYARAYIARGWSVIPLVPGTKRPAVALGPFLRGERRLTDEEVLSYFGAHFIQRVGETGNATEYGIGIVCGRPSGGLVVIDVDPRNGGDVRNIDAQIFPGPRVYTGGGGLHIYCAGDAPKGKTPLPGVDRQGEGSFVVAPPALHASGAAYRWEEHTLSRLESYHLPLPSLPAWALEPAPRPAPPPGAEPTEFWIADTLADPTRIAPGSQEETLTKLCWYAAGCLPRDVAEGVLSLWMGRLTLGNPSDPWTLAHLTDRLDRAYERREQSFVVTSERGSAGALSNRDSTEGGSNGGKVAPPAADASAFVPLSALEFPEQRWIVEDFVAPGSFTEVIGKVKKGKSTLVYQLVRSILTGDEFLGRKVEQGPVVLLTEQAGGSLRATLERARLHGEALPLVVVQKPGLSSLGDWREAVGKIVDHAIWLGAQLIVVDTLSRLAKVSGDAENSSGSVAILDPFDRARGAGLACLFVRHARKGAPGTDEDIADSARGSSAITGDMDIVIRLRPAGDKGDKTLRILSWESRITDDPEDLALSYVDGQYQVVDMPEGAKVVKYRERVEEMRRMVADGLSYTDIQLRPGWSSPNTIAKYKRLVEEGEALPAAPDAVRVA